MEVYIYKKISMVKLMFFSGEKNENVENLILDTPPLFSEKIKCMYLKKKKGLF